MGTSSIYKGPIGKNPLLPEGFEDDSITKDEKQDHNTDNNEKKQEDNEKQMGSWQETKKAMSQYIKGSSSSKARVLNNYVKAYGGAKRASTQSASGRNSTVQLGKFLSSIRSVGIIKTFEKLHIDYVGKSVETLLSEMVNIISSNSNTKEDAIARNATIEALSEIYDFLEQNNKDITSLDRIDDCIFEQIMSIYISDYIFEKMLNDLQSRFEQYAKNTQEALRVEKEFKDYIKNSVDIKLKQAKLEQIDYNNADIGKIIENLYTECFEVLEVCV
ncbi:hypothetical protein IAI10_10165 [Clostridium sp. 19966]|uniref:Uncharacterized protein n=1 Tax=Clostridium butyricum TaxID=1492 RepID=A0A6N2ZVD3_CLOBU|nr:Qat anti-phage system associated protein QatB [Clostridium sp. 19966]MDT8717022.1 hypothetical protein [Clostridium sp. 19966]